MTTECIESEFDFPACKSKKVKVDFKGGNVSSIGGALLLKQADRALSLCQQAASCITDSRRSGSVIHSVKQMLSQRVFAMAAGEEDVNDHEELRKDIVLQTAAGSDLPLASPSTLCRFEKTADRQAALEMNTLLVDTFITSHSVSPGEIILDFDATDDRVHGNQEGKFFHGYYDHYCFLPLYVFCGSQLLCAYLRPSKNDGAKHAWAILSLIVKRLRQKWPELKITFRGDSGFCRWRMLRWCEQNEVHYIVGMAQNARTETLSKSYTQKAERRFEESSEKQRIFGELKYGAKSWDKERRVIIKAEHHAKGSNVRLILSNLQGDAQELYDQVYCARGDMENRIKEQQLDLFADRTSCHRWWSNPFRLLLSSLAYTLLEYVRRKALQNTRLARASSATIRNKLIRIGAVVTRNTRRIRIHLSSGCSASGNVCPRSSAA